jgi:ribonucleoside-triphosphate reductase (thioredoxin)
MIEDYVFKLKYARYNKKEQRRETWKESVLRYTQMLKDKFSNEINEIDEIEQAIIDKEILPSMRGLQFGGDAIKEKNMRMYNCTCSYADRPRFFSEALWLLLCGSGVGYSAQSHHVAKLPKIKEPKNYKIYQVSDSIEGWGDAVNMLIDSYMSNGAYPIFDYSLIRPKGSPLRHGGLAPSHEPLQQALENIDLILTQAIGRQLKPIEVFDAVCFLANCTITAGTRRSATIAFFNIEDTEMLNAKVSKDWFTENPQRARANISAVVLPTATEEQFKSIFSKTKNYGEPAFLFLKSTEYAVNPCVEITMCPTLIKKDKGTIDHYTLDLLDPAKREYWIDQGYTFQSGWQACNLSTVNADLCHSNIDLKESVRRASKLGTYQASYTDTTYLGRVSQEIMEREALLGVSLCGMASKPDLTLNYDLLKECGQIAVNENIKTAQRLGIKPASRVTCVKPEGTASLILGGIGSGIHPVHAKRYLRRIQASETEEVFKHFAEQNPQAVEPSVWGSDFCTVFALEGKGTVKADLNAIELLDRARNTISSWIEQGTAHPQRLEGARHNVSLTVQVKPSEWLQVQEYLWQHKTSFTGVSLLSATGDYDYPQAPLVAVYEPTENSTIKQLESWHLWNLLNETVKSVDYETLNEKTDNTKPLSIEACAGGSCELK